MNVICDNPYFLLGLKSLYGDMKEVFCKHKPSDTICIISSSVFSEIYQFYSKINIADENVTFYASPSAVRCLSGITVRDVYNMSFFIPGFRNKENEDRRLTSNAQPKIKLTCAALLTAMILGRITPETVLITIISSEIFYLPFRCMTENEFFTTECINAFSFNSNISMLAY